VIYFYLVPRCLFFFSDVFTTSLYSLLNLEGLSVLNLNPAFGPDSSKSTDIGRPLSCLPLRLSAL
jgi:hypothetical protein